MNESTWLREALRRAAAAPPAPADRAAGAFGIARRRRRNKLVAASCTAVVAVFAATAITSGGAATSGLQPTDSVATRPAGPLPSALPGQGRPGVAPGVAAGDPAVALPETGPAPGGAAGPGATAGDTDQGQGGPAAAGAPLEVYFLVDATATMQGSRVGVEDAVGDITRRLASRTRLRHGLGAFRDWQLGVEALSGRQVYERLAPVGQGRYDVRSIRYYGGGDVPEAHTLALDAAIGHEHTPYTMNTDPAGFSPGARKVVVLVTDSHAHQDGDYPSIDEVVGRLNAAGVAVVGLHARLAGMDPELAAHDLGELARGTRATARRGVDCDGDRRTDVRRGAPLVCEVRGAADYSGFADALLARFS